MLTHAFSPCVSQFVSCTVQPSERADPQLRACVEELEPETVLKSIHDANKGVADGPTPIEEVDELRASPRARVRKAKEKVV